MPKSNKDLIVVNKKICNSVHYEHLNNSDNKVMLHNNIYQINLGKLNSKENDLLFAIFSVLKNKGNISIKFTLKDLKILLDVPKINNQELEKLVISLWEKLRNANFWIIGKNFKENVMLFDCFRLNYADESHKEFLNIEIQLNNDNFGYLINELFKNFTQFDLKQFQNLKSKYAKNLFRLFKRFENVSFSDHKGKTFDKHAHALMIYKYDIDGFKKFMGISEKMSLNDMESKILIPACNELCDEIYLDIGKIRCKDGLKKIYSTITIQKNRFSNKEYKRSVGNKVIGIEFEYKTKEANANKVLNRVEQIQFVSSEKVRQKSHYYTEKEIHSLNEIFLNKSVLITKNYAQVNVNVIFIKTEDTPVISFVCDVLGKNKERYRQTFNFFSLKDLSQSVIVLGDSDKTNEATDPLEEYCQNNLLNKQAKIITGNKIPKPKTGTILSVKFQKSGKVKLEVFWHDKQVQKVMVFDSKEIFCESVNVIE